MGGTVKLRRLAAVKKPRTTQTEPARYFVGGGIGRPDVRVVLLVVHSACRGSQQVAESSQFTGYRGGAISSQPHHSPF